MDCLLLVEVEIAAPMAPKAFEPPPNLRFRSVFRRLVLAMLGNLGLPRSSMPL
jgi:hypothetical protein